MRRPVGTKSIMRSEEEKERIILEYLNGDKGLKRISKDMGISYSVLHKWYVKYQKNGIKGLKSNIGRAQKKGINKKRITEEEKLKQIIMKQEIEIARLKKEDIVKGVGEQKEYITTLEKI